jgi:hypothetical protein
VKTEDLDDLGPVKARHRVPQALAACHTAVVDGYAVEGHVPAETIRRLLREHPAVSGIAVPGMPPGSPGMESPGQAPQRHQVLTFDRNGRTGVFESR